jgi:dolichol-phosphate mannosyltransferase
MKNQNNEKVIILIPSLEPDKNLLSYVNEMKACGLIDIIIVDDGSGEAYQPIFNKLADDGCVVLHHSENRGKGCALKTGLYYIQENYNPFAYVVMVDSDGQHAIEDVVRIIELSKQNPNALTLGVRDFNKPGIPVKSLLGNRVASFMFFALYGKLLIDTQTGLRAFGVPLIEFMLAVRGNRFEYEIQMLIACLQADIAIQTIPIQVIYENNNKGTHFKPFQDSIQIMGTLFSNFLRFLSSSIISAAVDIGIAWFFLDFLRPFVHSEYLRILAATVIARVISIGVNYLLNRNFVFQEKKAAGKSLSRYLILCVMIIIFSTTGVYGLHISFGVNEKIGKIICDTLLFILSYQVQQRWVFAKGDTKDDK